MLFPHHLTKGVRATVGLIIEHHPPSQTFITVDKRAEVATISRFVLLQSAECRGASAGQASKKFDLATPAVGFRFLNDRRIRIAEFTIYRRFFTIRRRRFPVAFLRHQ